MKAVATKKGHARDEATAGLVALTLSVLGIFVGALGIRASWS
jgi:hypothetical protein